MQDWPLLNVHLLHNEGNMICLSFRFNLFARPENKAAAAGRSCKKRAGQPKWLLGKLRSTVVVGRLLATSVTALQRLQKNPRNIFRGARILAEGWQEAG